MLYEGYYSITDPSSNINYLNYSAEELMVILSNKLSSLDWFAVIKNNEIKL